MHVNICSSYFLSAPKWRQPQCVFTAEGVGDSTAPCHHGCPTRPHCSSTRGSMTTGRAATCVDPQHTPGPCDVTYRKCPEQANLPRQEVDSRPPWAGALMEMNCECGRKLSLKRWKCPTVGHGDGRDDSHRPAYLTWMSPNAAEKLLEFMGTLSVTPAEGGPSEPQDLHNYRVQSGRNGSQILRLGHRGGYLRGCFHSRPRSLNAHVLPGGTTADRGHARRAYVS